MSLELADILRKRIDECAKWKRNVEIPEELVERCAQYAKEGKLDELSEQEWQLFRDFLFSYALERFLEAKENLVIPDDARVPGKLIRFFEGDLGLRFAYQDFYAYKFCDMLDDIVQRAFLVRDVFTKKPIPEEVKQATAEAYRCFLHGLNMASIILCRAIVEASLKLALKVEVGDLVKLNDFALRTRKISPDIHGKVDSIRREANRYVHRVPQRRRPSEKETLKILDLTQYILSALLSSGSIPGERT